MDGAERTVVGVVGDVRHSSLSTGPRTEVYMLMIAQETENGYGELVILAGGDPHDVLPALKSAVLAGSRMCRSVRSRRWGRPWHENSTTAAEHAHAGALRPVWTRDLGGRHIGRDGLRRLAADQGDGHQDGAWPARWSVMSMVLSSAGLLLVAGLALGTAGAWYLRATAKTFLFGLDAADPRAFAAAIVSLSVAVLVASIIPARRAASVDPVVALRAE